MYHLKHRDPRRQKLSLSRWNTRSLMNCRWKSTECRSPTTIRQDKSFLDLNLKNSMSFLKKGFVGGHPISRMAIRAGKSDHTTRVRPDLSCPDWVRTRRTVRFIGPGSCSDTICLERGRDRTYIDNYPRFEKCHADSRMRSDYPGFVCSE